MQNKFKNNKIREFIIKVLVNIVFELNHTHTKDC